jgi:HEAT repeat protein
VKSQRLILAVSFVLAGAFVVAGQGAVFSKLEGLLQLKGNPVAASSAVLSEHEMEEINAAAPQDQVMRLLERTINHYWGAGEEIEKRSEDWIGQVHSTPELTKLTDVAYFSSDLRVRAAALEIWRVEAGYRKTPETVQQIINAAAVSPDRKYYFLSHLGILGNRGVERQRVLDTLVQYLHDPDGNTRSAAINGLGLLGTESTIAPLLAVFHDDPSHDLRERAACNLADSGMLSQDLRKQALPELVRFSQDPNLDETTKKWVYQALREISQQPLGNDPSAWVSWYGAQATLR